jgi:hypothetical protein
VDYTLLLLIATLALPRRDVFHQPFSLADISIQRPYKSPEVVSTGKEEEV